MIYFSVHKNWTSGFEGGNSDASLMIAIQSSVFLALYIAGKSVMIFLCVYCLEMSC